MFEKRDKLTPISKAMLLLAYENKGIEGKAKILYDMILKEKIEDKRIRPLGVRRRRVLLVGLGGRSPRDDGLRAAGHGQARYQKPLITKTIRWLIVNRTGSYWLSTKATGKIIYALSDYLTRTGESSPNYTMTVTLNGKEINKKTGHQGHDALRGGVDNDPGGRP